LAIITLIHGNFWTGNINTSFITNFDTQASVNRQQKVNELKLFNVGLKHIYTPY